MIRLFFKGNNVPVWLEKQEPIKGQEDQFKPGSITFGSMCVVWLCKGQYSVVKLGTSGSIFHMSGGASINLAGQSKGVHLYQNIWWWLKC